MERTSEQRVEGRRFANREWRNGLQTRIEIPLLVRLLRVPTGLDFLETGCGSGVGLVALARICRPASITGVDVDDDLLMLAQARCAERYVMARLVHGDIRDLPFEDGSFDVVVDFGTLYHVTPEEQALQEIARVLRSEGLLVHETPLAQLLAHPVLSSRKRLSWALAPQLAPRRSAGLWACRVKRDDVRDVANA